ncbi:MAG: glycosyltransferase family 2 protein, partial [Cytophagaceae bacterium]
MKISGFSYIRNGFTYQYPFLEAIQSVLPLCDEFIIAVGDSTDGTREAIEALGDPRIRIVDTVWDETMRQNGKIFALQANTALRMSKPAGPMPAN